ncbi:hypothetical protein GBA65_06690 [Rubrobacter marinus]|uniref:Glycoside hydrolase family 3 N-terminal domain-containing protein n=1 Tax=Rubrobacter marinus TaxID=2653852 RepID=A0A6G8PVL5_9ACTN|nr:glycoside hydrolase family 3 N-terminal domain-containing protein [Rubrobacter marinus]QIN78248.1 hypothetical protein GBA65_06690 [Rubrobacter marinus]
MKKRTLLALLVSLALPIAGCGGSTPEGANTGETGPAGATAGGEGLDLMSVRDAVGQMFVVSMSGTEPDYYIRKMIRERNIGGVILFGANMESEEGTRRLTRSLQELSMATEPRVPLFVAVDHEGGAVQHAPWVGPQPPAAEVGLRGDPGEARRISLQIGRELRGAGVNTDFAPVADTGSGAAIGDRSYGSDPELVGRMVAAAVEGFEEAGVVSAAKHFPNHGPALEDSHVGYPRVEHGTDEVRAFDLPPFRAAVEAGVPMVMVGHLVYPALDPGRPASLSPRATAMLREELGFRGVIVTDDLAMEGAKRGGTVARAAVEAVAAGADLLVVSGLPQEQADAYDAVVAAVESGEIPRARIEESLQRIEQVKRRYSLAG